MSRAGKTKAVLTLLSFVAVGVLAVVFINAVPDESPTVSATAESTTTTASSAAPSTTTTTSTTSTTVEPDPVPREVVPVPEERTAQLAFTGDTLAHGAVVRQAGANASGTDVEYDFAPMFASIEPYLSSADLAICHLETPLSPDNTRLSGFPTFNVPREMADGLRESGFDGCTTASNHSLDQWPQGVVDTLDVLEEAGLGHSGMARDQAEYDDVTLYDANGITIASLSYTFSFNGFLEPEDTPWLVNLIDIEEIAAEATRAREAGANYIVLSLHWGDEYRHEPNQFQLDNAEALIAAADIDLIIGHHAHVVQPVSIVDGVPVVFGLGNILSNQSASCCAVGAPDGVVMLVDIAETVTNGRSTFSTSFSYVPTRVDRSNFTIVPVIDIVADAEAGLVELSAVNRDIYVASRERTADALKLSGDEVGIVEVSSAGS